MQYTWKLGEISGGAPSGLLGNGASYGQRFRVTRLLINKGEYEGIAPYTKVP